MVPAESPAIRPVRVEPDRVAGPQAEVRGRGGVPAADRQQPVGVGDQPHLAGLELAVRAGPTGRRLVAAGGQGHDGTEVVGVVRDGR